MSDPGRNDPCPCGSGQRHKKCCLLKAAGTSAEYTRAERESGQLAVGRFSRRHELDGDRAIAHVRFWESALEIVSEDDPDVMEQGEAFFHDWFTLDFRPASGLTLVDALAGAARRCAAPAAVGAEPRPRLSRSMDHPARPRLALS